MSEPITCEIVASKQRLTTELAKVARTCSSEIGIPMVVKARIVRRREVEPAITLHLTAELASQQHPIWCLACRMACFADGARVSVMVQGGDAFAKQTEPQPETHVAQAAQQAVA